ncbi:MAG: alpha/beta fold hydrolase [Pikeienuella sp.]|uniref:alpha/beta fold hydrolase n=1 Tax=Pikeienuella sp. TaxID=2831957 RepID=UPI00391D6F34
MTIAFVHGVPETADIWAALRAEMGEETVTLSKPGFGAPLPAGFNCMADGYLDWLIGEVSALPGPVDLIGHDWGGIHVVRLVMARPDLVRSWVSDVVGVFDPSYRWHDLAQAWQTPNAGEQAVAMMAAAPAEMKAAQLAAAHMPADVAAKVAAAMNAEMGRAILPLYRSATQPFLARIGERAEAAAARPGLAIVATEDAYTGGAEPALRMAERMGAEVAVLEGESHWWMANQPRRGAEIIRSFLQTLG